MYSEKWEVPTALTFDDVLLVPAESYVEPSDADTRTRFTRNISLNIPVISAAMDTVTESRMSIALAREGSIGVLHRNMPAAREAEEIKIVNETRKILNNADLSIGATCMRVPVSIVHVEAVTVRFKNKPSMTELRKLLQKNRIGVKLVEETVNEKVSGTDSVFVSRLRKDLSNDYTVSFIVSADNLRVGAALNGIRIAERLIL